MLSKSVIWTSQKLLFVKVAPQPKKVFNSTSVRVVQKLLFTFSHSGKKWTLLFHSFWRFLHYVTTRYAFLTVWGWHSMCEAFHITFTRTKYVYAASDSFSVNFGNVRMSHLSALFQDATFIKEHVKSFYQSKWTRFFQTATTLVFQALSIIFQRQAQVGKKQLQEMQSSIFVWLFWWKKLWENISNILVEKFSLQQFRWEV